MSDRNVMKCEEAIRLLAQYLDGELEEHTGADLEQHMELCRSCYSRHEFEKGLKSRISALGEETVQPDFEDRIRSLVASFTEPERDTSA